MRSKETGKMDREKRGRREIEDWKSESHIELNGRCNGGSVLVTNSHSSHIL